MSGVSGWRRAAFGAIVAAAAVVVLTAGAGSGAAATSMTVHLTSLIDSVSGGGGPGNLPAGRIAYHVTVDNDLKSSSVTHVVLTLSTTVVNAAAPATASFESVTSTGATCGPTAVPSQLQCTISRLPAGSGFAADVSFTAPSDVTPANPSLPVSVEATAVVTVSAQTNGAAGNNGTSTWPAQENAVSTAVLPPSASSIKSFLHAGESLPDTGVVLHTKQLTLPASFVFSTYGVVTAASEVTGTAACETCPTKFLDLGIPASLTASNPFSATNPFTFTLTLDSVGQPDGYEPLGVTHDGVQLQECSTLPVAGPWPTGMCQDGPLSTDAETGELRASVKGYENGFVGFD